MRVLTTPPGPLRSSLLATLAVAGCGSAKEGVSPPTLRSQIALTVGPGPRFMPRAAGPLPAPSLPCGARPGRRYGAHIELFAARHVVQVPAGIGIAAPRRRGAYVTGGRCWHGLYTTEPTGLIEVGSSDAPTLRTLFALWRQPLSRTRLLSFRGRVRAYLAGRRWRGDPRAIPLARHAQVVLEVGPLVPPHPSYRFPPGL